MKRHTVYCCLILLLVCGEAFAFIIEVPGDAPTIQAGIDLSSDGDTVLVQPGTYLETIDFHGHSILLGSLFIIAGDTSYINQTVIDGSYGDSSAVSFQNGETESAICSGFTICNGQLSGIYCQNSSPLLENLQICYSSGNYLGGGIRMLNASPLLRSLYLHHNNAQLGGAIYCSNSTPLMENLVIAQNQGYD
ncbi:MAG: hypothetical protein ISR91_07985 [Candidatus Delongbacteria bacterium]|nr:hypothetical protein [Candidatus Delongbacteria bacterium]